LLPQALLNAQRAVAVNPGRSWERSILADVYWALGEYKSAEAEWITCLDLSPEPGSWAGIASGYWQQGVFLRDPVQRKKAFQNVIEFYGRALKIMESTSLTSQHQSDQIRDHGSMHYWTGRFYQELLEFDRAVGHLQAAKNMGYKPLESTVYLGWVHTEAQNYDAAEASFREAVSRIRGQQKQGRQLSNVDSGLGEETAMHELLVLTCLLWSFSYSDRGARLAKAEQLALRTRWLIQQLDAAKVQTFEATRLDCLGFARLRMGRISEAIKAFEASLALSADAGAWVRLAEAYTARAANRNLRESCLAKARDCCARSRIADLRQQYVQQIKELEERLAALAKSA
jgi:tetratricopeptide (TPR) repeat protein